MDPFVSRMMFPSMALRVMNFMIFVGSGWPLLLANNTKSTFTIGDPRVSTRKAGYPAYSSRYLGKMTVWYTRYNKCGGGPRMRAPESVMRPRVELWSVHRREHPVPGNNCNVCLISQSFDRFNIKEPSESILASIPSTASVPNSTL